MPNRRHARRTHRDAAKLAAADNHQGALAVYAAAAAEYRGCLAVHPDDHLARTDYTAMLAERGASHTRLGEHAAAFTAHIERVHVAGPLDLTPADRADIHLDLADTATRAGRLLTAATETDTALSLLDDTDPHDPASPGFAHLATALARAARVYARAADPDLAVGAADQAARMLIATGGHDALLRDCLRLAAGLHHAAGRTGPARGAAGLLAERFPGTEPLTGAPALTFRSALDAAQSMGLFPDTALIARLCPDPADRGAAATAAARCDLGFAAVALHAASQTVDTLAPMHPGLAWRIATEVHYLLHAADRQAERNLHLNFRDHGPSWLAMLMALTTTGKTGPIMDDLATALADLRERLHSRHAAAGHAPLVAAADRFIDLHTPQDRR
ncbi:hypothetical protein AB0B28_14360 [Glycomyces sp. NPDC046736]|uniref:hypothetical protein n=1 Tax=Glycomyces sp. NPDC046736 TaxID=3155615 RepID=UPI0033D4AFB9